MMNTMFILLSGMQTGLQHTHKGLRTVLVIFLLVTLGSSLAGWLKKGPYTKTNQLTTLITMILAHIQLILGLGLYFMSEQVKGSVTYWKFEHPTMMILAIILISLGYSISKRKANPIDKHKTTFIYFSIATLIVIVALSRNQISLFL